jgi:speckle-type POZ protein
MAGGGEPSRSASTIVANTASGYHILRIDGYSRTLATPTGEYIASLPFTVGGHRWHIRYYPNGKKSEAKDRISLFLYLHESVAKPVKAQFDFRFVGDVAEQPLTLGGLHIFDNQSAWGRPQFIKREDFEASKHLRDDSFAIRCDVIVTTEFRTEEALEATTPADSISVPPSDLHQHLGGLLVTEKGADVVFDVAGETFAAHRCVLAARSPVFSAEFFGAMKESDTGGVVHIEDMEPRVFKALLYFVYTDLLFPSTKTKTMQQVEDDDEDVLSQHLLVAADKYNLERLKLLCEKKLCEYISADNVATILALAEQHHCHGLKKVCFHFLSSPANLRAAMASDGFKHLSRSCPSVMHELVAMLAT